MDFSTLNTTFGIIEHNELDKLPSLTLEQTNQPSVRLRGVATIDGQDASSKTYAGFAEAIAQGRDVTIDFDSARIWPASE